MSPTQFLTASLALLAAAPLSAQFHTPDYRASNNDADFAWWDGFDAPYTAQAVPYTGLNYNQVNEPLFGGNFNARLAQDAVANAIITSSGGIYSFGDDATAFKVYDNPAYSPGAILLQLRTLRGSNTLIDLSTVKLFYRESAVGAWIEYAGTMAHAVRGSDSVGHVYDAWEWNTEGLTIEDYYVQFAYEESHSPLVAAQLDTNPDYVAQLDGYAINFSSNVLFGQNYGTITRSPEKLIYDDGDTVTLTAVPTSNFVFVKWIGPFGESTDNPLTIDVTDQTNVQLVLAPISYTVWRQMAFPSAHGGEISTADWADDNDYDFDGRINALEYALGGEPETSDLSTKAARLELMEISGVTYPALVFDQQIAAGDLSYTVQISADNQTWLDNTTEASPVTAAEEVLGLNDDGTRQVRIRSLVPLNAPAPLPFMRLSISLN